VVTIETAPQTKLDRMRALGATIIPVSYDEAWRAAQSLAFEAVEGKFIPPFDSHNFIAGHGTKGVEAHQSLHVWFREKGGKWQIVATSTTPAAVTKK
jgi:threonine dehydratase